MAITISGRAISNSIRMGVAPPSFNVPAFWSGQSGGFWNFSDSAYLFSDTGLTSPASLDGNVLGVTDLSGLGNHLTAVTGGRYFTRKSGWCEATAAPLQTPEFARGSTGYTQFFLFRPTTIPQTSYTVSMPLNADYPMTASYLNGSYYSTFVWGGAIQDSYTNSTVMVVNSDYFASAAVNDNSVTPIMSVRIDGVTQSGGTVQGLVTTNSRVTVGAVGQANVLGTNPFYGRMYCAAWINKACTAQEITDIGNYMNEITGITAVIV
jgi:hypothetical protein